MTIYSIVLRRFREVLDEPSLVLTDELSAVNVKSWDSLNHITLVVEIQSINQPNPLH